MKFTNLTVSTYIGDTFGSKVNGPESVHALAISTSPRSFVDGRGDDVSESFVSDSKSTPSVEHAIAQGNPDSRLILDQSNLNHVMVADRKDPRPSASKSGWVVDVNAGTIHKMKIPIEPKVDEEPLEEEKPKNAFQQVSVKHCFKDDEILKTAIMSDRVIIDTTIRSSEEPNSIKNEIEPTKVSLKADALKGLPCNKPKKTYEYHETKMKITAKPKNKSPIMPYPCSTFAPLIACR